VIRRRRGVLGAWTTAAVNLVGAAARVVWMTPLAIVFRRWRGPRRECVRWVTAHRQGLRSPAALARQD
jgi:hypothetical protein